MIRWFYRNHLSQQYKKKNPNTTFNLLHSFPDTHIYVYQERERDREKERAGREKTRERWSRLTSGAFTTHNRGSPEDAKADDGVELIEREGG